MVERAPEQSISIAFTFETADASSLSARPMSSIWLVFYWLLFFVILVGALWPLFLEAMQYGFDKWSLFNLTFPILGLAFVGLLIVPSGRQWWTGKFSGVSDRYPMDVKMQIDSYGLHTQSIEGSADLLWSGFQRAEETKNHFFLFQSKRCAVVVPKRALTNEDKESIFREMVKSRITDFSQYKG